MSVTSTTNRKSYSGDGVTTSFATNPVVFFVSSDLAVSVVSAAGVETALTENTHYTVTGGDRSTGTVNLAGGSAPYGAPAVGVTLLILRVVPLTQPVDFVQNDGSDAEVQETAYDRLTMVVQQLDEVDARAIKLPPVETGSTALTELPFDRASKFLAFDASKNLIAAAGTTGVPVSAFMETVLDDATAADARTTLGVPASADTILKSIIDAKGDLIVGTANDTPARKVVGANGTVLVADSTQADGLLWSSAPLPYNYLTGLALGNNATDPTNDIDIGPGSAKDSTNAVDMVLGGGLVKRLDAAWAVGSGNGGLDTGAIANTTYHVWLIKRSDTGVVDALFSTSATAPTMPANYDYKRRIGSIIRAGGVINLFLQDGDLFTYKTSVEDIAATNPGTFAVTRTMGSIPNGIRVRGVFLAQVRSVTVGSVITGLLSDLSATDVGLANDGTSDGNFWFETAVSGQASGARVEVMTSTGQQIRSRIGISDANTVLRIRTCGWFDTRGK